MNLRPFTLARLVALLVPLGMIVGAWISQIWGGLFPCEMCHWQRWPHYAAVGVALAAFAVNGAGQRRALVLLAAVLVAVSGAIGVFHAGVEYGWWEGITQCTAAFQPGSSNDMLAQIMNAPLIRCDVAPWSLFGISLAGWNAIFSLAGSAVVLTLLAQDRRA